MINFRVVTLFPESMDSYLNSSILRRAKDNGVIDIHFYNPRDFAMSNTRNSDTMTYAERRVDDRPYGGGPGMVIEALPVIRAVHKAVDDALHMETSMKNTIPDRESLKNIKIIFFSPAGKSLDNKLAEKWKKYSDIILICGHYEGIDNRVKKVFPMIDISVGPYTLTGGELPAMIVIDAVTRRLEGAIGNALSVEEKRVSSSKVYTRPEVIEYAGKKYKVPKILLGGHHSKISEWKKAQKG